MSVVGRLAPTPSGYLHLGNARSFLLAWLWARANDGRVVMRIEDIDTTRCRPEYREQVLGDLAWLGLDWDEGPNAGDATGAFDQSTRTDAYRAALKQLIDSGHAYPCVCSRKDIEEAASAPHSDEGVPYAGTCRDRWESFEQAATESGRTPAWRFRWQGVQRFRDHCRGDVEIDPARYGDFVLWRRDDLPSYQLAVTVDDAAQGVTQVLRGHDLLVSTGRQLALYNALGLRAPSDWAHVGLLRDTGERRLAKRDGDLSMKALRERAVDPCAVVAWLAQSWGHAPVANPLAATPQDAEPFLYTPSDLLDSFRIGESFAPDATLTNLPF